MQLSDAYTSPHIQHLLCLQAQLESMRGCDVIGYRGTLKGCVHYSGLHPWLTLQLSVQWGLHAEVLHKAVCMA